jgi:hypothetical protein
MVSMGSPNGPKADAYAAAVYTDNAEWDVGTTILLATLPGGVASNLQA